MRSTIAVLAILVGAAGVHAAESDLAQSTTFKAGPPLVAFNSQGAPGRSPSVAALVYDAFTNATTLTTTTGSPRTYMGTPFTVAPAGSLVTVSGARVYLASTAAQSYSNGLAIRVQFWDGFDGSSASAIFSTPVSTVQTATVPGPVTLTLNSFTPIDLTFAPPIVLNGSVNNGIDINFQGDNGAGLASIDTLTSLICAVPTPGPHTLAVGSFVASGTWVSPQFGFYRNAANQTNFNHPNTDLRVFTGQDDIRLCLQLTADVTPVELQHFSVQ
jgi:hypothetical protein